MKKIKKFDLNFIHEIGNYKLEGCTQRPHGIHYRSCRCGNGGEEEHP